MVDVRDVYVGWARAGQVWCGVHGVLLSFWSGRTLPPSSSLGLFFSTIVQVPERPRRSPLLATLSPKSTKNYYDYRSFPPLCALQLTLCACGGSYACAMLFHPSILPFSPYNS